jgi:hypothetical protein
MQPKRPSTLNMAAIAVALLAMIIMVVSMIPWTPWASFDRTRAIGPVNYHLEADFDAIGFQYTMETVEAENGTGGGLGLGGGLASNFSISREKTYPQGRGEFLENIGIIYNSYDNKAFQYELKMKSPPQDSGVTWEEVGNPSALLNITLESDLIPWWPESGKRTLDVKIVLEQVDLMEQVSPEDRSKLHIQINKVTIMAKTGYDKETGEYTGPDKQLAQKETELVFTEPGDHTELEFSVGYPSGTDAAGFYVEVQGNMTDFWGRTELSPLSRKANPINIYPMSTGKVIQGVGIPLALPLMIISSILALAGITVSIFNEKKALYLKVPSGLLAILAPFWFFLGMNAAVDLLGERLIGAEEGLTWGAGLFIAFAGGSLMIIALVLSIIPIILAGRSIKEETVEEPKEKAGPVFKKIEEKEDQKDDGPVFNKIS